MTDSKMTDWPARPDGEVFPEVLDSVLVAQLLGFDRDGCTLNNGRRRVCELVKEKGLPTLRRIGKGKLFSRSQVLQWLNNDENQAGAA